VAHDFQLIALGIDLEEIDASGGLISSSLTVSTV
jgi:hypothetical protein